MVEPTKSGRWSASGKILSALVGLATLLITAVVAFAPTETTDIGKARAFLGSYFANAPYQPNVTWDRLSDSYRANGELAKEKLTYSSYEAYFSQFERMEVTNVGHYDGQNDEWYVADLFRQNKNGDQATTRFAYQLQCPWESKLPLLKCSAGNIEILNVCIVQPSGLCKQDE